MTNRHPVANWFITFPQVEECASKGEFHEQFPPSLYSICCEEEHADGSKHLHLGLRLKKGITQARLVKWVKERWPDDWKRIHFKAVKDWGHVQDYCRKEDPAVVERGELEKKKKESPLAVLQRLGCFALIGAIREEEARTGCLIL